jgi:hypothetical protein
MWKLTTNPLIILWSPGGWEMIIILIITLILLGGLRWPGTARGMGESIRNWKAGISGARSQQSIESHPALFLVLALFPVAIILSAMSLYNFSDKQKLALAIVLLGWVGVGYWSFGRTLQKRDKQ